MPHDFWHQDRRLLFKGWPCHRGTYDQCPSNFFVSDMSSCNFEDWEWRIEVSKCPLMNLVHEFSWTSFFLSKNIDQCNQPWENFNYGSTIVLHRWIIPLSLLMNNEPLLCMIALHKIAHCCVIVIAFLINILLPHIYCINALFLFCSFDMRYTMILQLLELLKNE